MPRVWSLLSGSHYDWGGCKELSCAERMDWLWEIICQCSCKLNEPMSYQVSVTSFRFSLWNPAGCLMILLQLWWANLSLTLQSQFWKGLQSSAVPLVAAVPDIDTYISRSFSCLALPFWMELRLVSPRISLLALLCHLQHNHCLYRMSLFAASGDNKGVIPDWLACPCFAVYWGCCSGTGLAAGPLARRRLVVPLTPCFSACCCAGQLSLGLECGSQAVPQHPPAPRTQNSSPAPCAAHAHTHSSPAFHGTALRAVWTVVSFGFLGLVIFSVGFFFSPS